MTPLRAHPAALAAALFVWAALLPARALEPVAVLSRSEQFLTHGLPLPASFWAAGPASGVSYVHLDPNLLAVSCEHIKDVLLRELGLKDQWKGKVTLFLHPVRADNEPIRVTSTRYRDGWLYRVEMPDQVERDRFVRAVMEVLLLEMANRRAGRPSAELPPWLVAGLTAHLESVSGLIIERARHERRQEPLRALRERLQQRPPLSWQELSWPDNEPLAPADPAQYRDSAHLLIWHLLRLKDGRECLREMMAQLPDHLNWQTAFLRAFRPHFASLADVEKWWALNAVHFSGHDVAQSWPRDEAWRKLDDILLTSVEIRLKASELPLASRASLQTIIAEWDYLRQRPLLQRKINHLQALRWRVPRDVLALVDDYLATLDHYLQQRDRTSSAPVLKNETLPNIKIVRRDTLRQLDALDAERLQLQRQTNAANARLMDAR